MKSCRPFGLFDLSFRIKTIERSCRDRELAQEKARYNPAAVAFYKGDIPNNVRDREYHKGAKITG